MNSKTEVQRFSFKLTKNILLFIFFSFTFCLTPIFAQKGVSISGIIKDKTTKIPLPYVNVILKTQEDSIFVTGVASNEDGRFNFENIEANKYFLEISYIGYLSKRQALYVGDLSPFLILKTIELEENTTKLAEIVIESKAEAISDQMDKKTFSLADNISQSGASVLQSMQNLPGITVENGKVQLRGSDKVSILIDGKQSAITGFGSQYGLDNIPASAIEKIEIINNPSAKYDANGNAGIINIIYKKNKQEGFNGKISLTTGLGALWIKKNNLPSISPQYKMTPTVNPSLSLSYRKNKVNLFFQGDYSYKQTLNKNEFVNRIYADGTRINQQTKRNRDTNFGSTKLGLDWFINDANKLTGSAYFGSEKILDRGEEPFFNGDFSERLRLWKFVEDEVKTTFMAATNFHHKFKQAGHQLNISFNYTFHREDEKYSFDNIQPTFTGKDSFKLLSDEQVADFKVDYMKPLKSGILELGFKFRKRNIPNNMQFFQGLNSPLDAGAGGKAIYKETIPALYGNYVFENTKYEAEIGMRLEYMKLNYYVNPDHNTYSSNGYTYFQPFPNLRLAYKINENNKLSLFFNRRVDRPNEVDIRIFPKYDDAEIIKVGNPALRPQFTTNFELGYKKNWEQADFYLAAYHRIANATITRISSTVDESKIIYAIFQNVNKSYNTGIEMVISQKISKFYSFNFNLNAYRNQIDAFTVLNKYPIENTFTAAKQEIYSGNAKLNTVFHFTNSINAQITAIYLAPDIIPQGKIQSRFSLDFGITKKIQKGKGELFLNASDLLNTMNIRKQIQGQNFKYTSRNYYQTQIVRLGYSYKF